MLSDTNKNFVNGLYYYYYIHSVYEKIKAQKDALPNMT